MPTPYLPAPIRRGSPGSIATALETRWGERAVSRHAVHTAITLAFERIDSQAAAEATRINMREEIDTLAYGQALAGDDPMAKKLVTNKVVSLAARNDYRLDMRFS